MNKIYGGGTIPLHCRIALELFYALENKAEKNHLDIWQAVSKAIGEWVDSKQGQVRQVRLVGNRLVEVCDTCGATWE